MSWSLMGVKGLTYCLVVVVKQTRVNDVARVSSLFILWHSNRDTPL